MKIIMKHISSIKTIGLNLLLISAGSVLCAVAIRGILVPKQFLAGGVTGLALLLHYVLPMLPVGVIFFVEYSPFYRRMAVRRASIYLIQHCRSRYLLWGDAVAFFHN
jgi:hypothetical protein